ncbi:unnamed protein product [Boreogadus saida]
MAGSECVEYIELLSHGTAEPRGWVSRAAWERGAYGGGVTLHVINLVKLHWQRGSSRGHMSLSVDGNT